MPMTGRSPPPSQGGVLCAAGAPSDVELGEAVQGLGVRPVAQVQQARDDLRGKPLRRVGLRGGGADGRQLPLKHIEAAQECCLASDSLTTCH